MRRIVAGLAILAVTALPSSAGPARQFVVGTIHMMAPAPPQPNSCFPGLTRNAYALGQEGLNGVVGYLFDVDRRTWNKPFALETADAIGFHADLDISFYKGIGDAYPAAAPENQVFEERGFGAEVGKVPTGMTKAIVCVYTGAEVTFRYTAGARVKAPPPPGKLIAPLR